MKKWCRQILKGLAYLHSRNPPVIHRDLKCDNVFISGTTGCVKIGDLGLATFKTQTFAKSMRGTMEFMAPEMFDEKYDELVDIYSFGLCMLEIITGEYPYIECKGPTAVIKRVTAGLKPDCYYKVENEDVREVIDCCIRTRKEERLPVNELLQHSFFFEDNGLRIDIVRDPSNDLQSLVTNNLIDLKLKIIDKTKRKALWTEHEAIRFRYNFTTDTPEKIVDELIQKKYIFDDDKKFMIQSIKDRLRAYRYEQLDRKAGVFCRHEKPTISQASHIVQQHQLQQQLVPPAQSLPIQQLTIPLVVQAQVPSVPAPIVVQQLSIEIPQQQIVKLSSEIPPVKSVVQTEPIPISQLSDLSSSVSGSAGSLEVLDAALKKTFNKNNAPHSTNTIATITGENSETPVSLVSQDESSISKLAIETAIIDQQQKEESVGTTIDELTTSKILMILINSSFILSFRYISTTHIIDITNSISTNYHGIQLSITTFTKSSSFNSNLSKFFLFNRYSSSSTTS
jgi:serine/threonine protein kinase